MNNYNVNLNFVVARLFKQ